MPPSRGLGICTSLKSVKRPFLQRLKNTLGVEGLAYLTTCNRVEFILVDEAYFCMGRLQQLFQMFEPDEAELRSLMGTAMVLHGEEAARHLLRVSAGLESMVLGEREILTQIRSPWSVPEQWGLAGDQLRITERMAVETAKQVFTETDICPPQCLRQCPGVEGLPRSNPSLRRPNI